MQLKLIQQYAEEFRGWLRRQEAEERLHFWESQRNWQEHWDLDAPKLKEMYDVSLANSQTKRLWKREAYEPKRMLLQFLDMEPDFVRSMFKDLFNEEKSIDGRVDRFVFYCDQLLDQYRRAQPLAIDTSHYHDDSYGMISLYLAFQYPDRYAPYEAARFLQLLQRLGAGNIPSVGDFPRHCKLMRTLYQLLAKDEELLQRHQERLQPERTIPEKAFFWPTILPVLSLISKKMQGRGSVWRSYRLY